MGIFNDFAWMHFDIEIFIACPFFQSFNFKKFLSSANFQFDGIEWQGKPKERENIDNQENNFNWLQNNVLQMLALILLLSSFLIPISNIFLFDENSESMNEMMMNWKETWREWKIDNTKDKTTRWWRQRMRRSQSLISPHWITRKKELKREDSAPENKPDDDNSSTMMTFLLSLRFTFFSFSFISPLSLISLLWCSLTICREFFSVFCIELLWNATHRSTKHN